MFVKLMLVVFSFCFVNGVYAVVSVNSRVDDGDQFMVWFWKLRFYYFVVDFGSISASFVS